MRCHLCADGVGEIADISCGDAWHRYEGETESGLSVVLARTPRGTAFLARAREAGYLTLTPSSAEQVIAGQGLTLRRQELFGRLLAFRLLGIPTPRYRGVWLFRAWRCISLKRKFVTVVGTLRRLLQRGLWHRNPVPRPSPSRDRAGVLHR
jgi:coenzyme F420 hydrogenase subunit beta